MKKKVISLKIHKFINIVTKVGFGIVMILFLGYLLGGEIFMESERFPSELDYEDISDDWTLLGENGNTSKLNLPTKIVVEPNEKFTISKQLDVQDCNSKWLMIWNKGQNIIVDVDGVFRQEYGRNTTHNIGRDIPYVYVFVPLYSEDKGKTISITYYTDNSRDTGTIGQIMLGDKTSLILSAVIPYQVEIVLAFFLVILGIGSVGGSYVIAHYKRKEEPLRYLGAGVMLTGMWIILNSQARQFVFPNISIVRDCAFLCVSTIPIPFSLYLDKIQEERFHIGYVIVEIGGIINFISTFILNIMYVKGLSEMFIGTFLVVMLPILWGIVALFIDTIKGNVKKYSLVAIGLLFFAMGTVSQMFLYLTSESGIVGANVMIFGIMCMLVCSIVYAMKLFGTVYTDGQEAAKAAETLKVASMQTLAKTVDAKDRYTKGHSERVAKYSREIAKRLGYSKKEQKNIYYVGLLHDVGKIGIPDSIINKPSKLTDEEYDVIKTHPGIGADILEDIKEIPNIAIGARFHHERFDGKGYPDGLKGEQIPLIARIIGVADAYDAMTSNRSYRNAMDQGFVRGEILRNKGIQFDPEIADIMITMIDEDIEYTMREDPASDRLPVG